MARPPARLATISSSCCCSWAVASNGDTQRRPHKRKNLIRREKVARRHREILSLCPGVKRRDSARNESFARRFTPNDPSGQLNLFVPTLSHPEGANESTVSATRSKIPLDCAIVFA